MTSRRLVVLLILVGGSVAHADKIYVVDPPRIWNRTDPIAAQQASSDKAYLEQVRAFRDERNKYLSDRAVKEGRPQPAAGGSSGCADLRQALSQRDHAKIRQVLSTAPTTSWRPSDPNITLLTVFRAWQGHCGLLESDLVPVVEAHGITVPRPTGQRITPPAPDKVFLQSPMGPPRSIPAPLRASATARTDTELLGNFVPEAGFALIQRYPTSGDRPIDKIQIAILPSQGAPSSKVEFLRELQYSGGVLVRVEDSYYCKTERGHDTCQRAKYGYRDGLVFEVGFEHGPLANKKAGLAPEVLPEYQPGALIVEFNGAPSAARFVPPIPSRFIQRFPKTDEPGRASAVKLLDSAYRLDQRAHTQTNRVTWTGPYPNVITIELREKNQRLSFGRRIQHGEGRVTSIEDSYYCAATARGAATVPCGSIRYDYQWDYLVASQVTTVSDWHSRSLAAGASKNVRHSALADTAVPTKAIYAPGSPPDRLRWGNDAAMREQLALAGPLQPAESFAGGLLPDRGQTTWEEKVWVNYTVKRHPYHGKHMFVRSVQGSRATPKANVIVETVTDRYFCDVPGLKAAIAPCGTITYSYDASGARSARVAAIGPPACSGIPKGEPGTRCQCDADAATSTTSKVLGSHPYFGDVCLAARHAGVIGPDGGAVTIKELSPCVVVEGSTKNGVTSGSFRGSRDSKAFVFVGKRAGRCLPWDSKRVPHF